MFAQEESGADLLALPTVELPFARRFHPSRSGLSERVGALFTATPALRPGLDRQALHPGLHGRDDALAAAAPPPCAQGPRPARGELPAGHGQSDALSLTWRAERVLAGAADDDRGVSGGD